MLSRKCFVLLACTLAPTAAQNRGALPGDGDVLLLSTDSPHRPLYNEVVAGLTQGLFRARSAASIEVLDVRPVFPDLEKADRERIARFRLSLGNRHFRVVIAFGQEALDFLLRARRELWPDAALVATGVTDEEFAAYRTVPGLTALTVSPLVEEQVRLITRLLPATRNIALVGGSGDLDRQSYAIVRESLLRIAGNLHLIELAGLRWDELVDRVGSLPPDTAILVTSMLRDADGRILPRITVMRLARRANAPVFGSGGFFGPGTLGGWRFNLREVGRELAGIVTAIERGNGLPPPGASRAFLRGLDWRELRRWGIPENRVPDGFRILNRPLPIWKTHPVDTGTAVLILLSELVLIVFLLRDRRQKLKHRREAEERARFEALIAEVVSWFVMVAPEALDERIDAALERLAAVVGAPAACLYSETPDGLVLTHAWPDRCWWLDRKPASDPGAPSPPQPSLSSIRITGREREVGVLQFAVSGAAMEEVSGRIGGLKTVGAALLASLSRRQAQRAVEEAETLSSAILKSLRVYLVVVDRNGCVVRADGRPYLVSDETDRFPFPLVSLGQSFEDALAESRGEHADRQRLVEAIRAARTQKLHSTLEFRYSHEGHGKWAGIQIYPFASGGGGATLVYYDMTTPKHLEAEYHAQFVQLTHMERVAALGQLASALAHEINQPLAAILTNAQASIRLLRRPVPDTAEVGAAIEDVVADVKRAAEVIAQMRALLRKEPVRAELNDAGVIADRIVGLMRTEATIRGVLLDLEQPGEPLPVHCSAVQIGQVLMNLISNALDAVSACEPHRRLVIVGAHSPAPGDMVEIWVRDCGPGLTAEAARQVFEPFLTTKEGGLGVGLSICRSIVEQHGGTIQVAPATGGGAVFAVRLPRAAGEHTMAVAQQEHA